MTDETDIFPVDILSWLTILEPRKAIMANSSSEDFSLYGADQLEKLVAHSSANVHAEEARSEFAMLKQVMVSSDAHVSRSFQQFAQTVLHEHSGVFTKMEKLIKTAMVIPFASVSCVRGFSTQNRIKT